MFLSTVATTVSIVESALFLCFRYATTFTLHVVGLTKKRDHQTQWLPTGTISPWALSDVSLWEVEKN